MKLNPIFSSTAATTTTAKPLRNNEDDGSGFNFFLQNVEDQRKKLQFIPGAIMMKDSEGNTVVKGGGLKLDDQVNKVHEKRFLFEKKAARIHAALN